MVHNGKYHVRVITLLINSSIWTEPFPSSDVNPPSKSMSSSYSSVDWVCHTGPISLCIDLFVFMCVYFVCVYFILHSCCIIVSMVGWT